jgi:hypothetical protein
MCKKGRIVSLNHVEKQTVSGSYSFSVKFPPGIRPTYVMHYWSIGSGDKIVPTRLRFVAGGPNNPGYADSAIVEYDYTTSDPEDETTLVFPFFAEELYEPLDLTQHADGGGYYFIGEEPEE